MSSAVSAPLLAGNVQAALDPGALLSVQGRVAPFDQDVYWVDRIGRPHLLTKTSERYRTNVIASLLDGAEDYYQGTVRKHAVEIVGEALHSLPGCHLVATAAGAPALPSVADQLTAEQWLEATPLMRTLRRLTPHAPAANLLLDSAAAFGCCPRGCPYMPFTRTEKHPDAPFLHARTGRQDPHPAH